MYPSLFSPFVLSGRRLKNRIVHASISTQLPQGAKVTDALIRYYANRARGGAAMLVTEPVSGARHQDLGSRVRAFNDDDADGLTRWAQAVESEDCRLVAQLFDRGRGRNVPGRHVDAIGASALPDDLSGSVPRELSVAEIESFVAELADAAARLRRCGFSGVELSSAHGHLFHQFLSPRSNLRTDRYGGDLAGRTRLVRELLAAIRVACGTDFIVGIKLPGDDGLPGSVGPAEAGPIAAEVLREGHASYVCFAQGSHARSLEMHVPDDFTPRATYMPLIRSLRPHVAGTPLVALGRVTDPAEADAILARGEAELVGLGRPLIADAAWPKKAAEGRAHDIRYCVSCNTCWERITALRLPIACDNNPRLGLPDEPDWRPAKAARSRRVVVVGAGPAGLEAAWVAAARGHEVTVFSASKEVGGSARLRSLLPGGESLSSVYDYQHAAARRHGVRFELGLRAGLDDVLALRPDAVVLAGGARMIPPQVLPAGEVPDLREAAREALRFTQRQRGTAVIYDTDQTEGVYAAAELFHRLFDRVVILTPRESVAQHPPLVRRQGILRRINEKRIRVLPFCEPRWSETLAESGVLECVNVYNADVEAIEEVALFAWATPRTPDDALLAPLRAAGLELHVVGDCKVARGMLEATAEGHAAGNLVCGT